MKRILIGLFLIAVFMPLTTLAQQVDPKAYYTNSEGELCDTTNIEDGEAPLDVEFRANPTNMDDWTPSYEWHFKRTNADTGEEELLVRYEENTQYTFTESGTYNIVLMTTLSRGDDTAELEQKSIIVVISSSKLEFPNAFSPNDDGINDIYGAKGVADPNSTEHYKSIVEFHAYIFNRWGQKLFEWTDVSKGWDGTYNGRPVKDGVYFVLVKAKGADGREYNIRRDVNLLRGYNQTESGSTTTE